MNTPRIASVEVAVELYYSTIALYTDDIRRLFPGASDTTVWRLKKAAREHTFALGRMLIDAKSVPTEDAFEAWGLNIDTIEQKYKKLKRLGLAKVPEAESAERTPEFHSLRGNSAPLEKLSRSSSAETEASA